MPIERPEPIAPTAICDLCGAKSVFEDVVDEDADTEDVFQMPLGWVLSSHVRRIANPDFAESMATATAQVEEAYKVALEQAKQLKQKVDRKEIKEAIEAQVFAAIDDDEFIEQELESVLCTDCSGNLQTRLCADEWDQEEEDDE